MIAGTSMPPRAAHTGVAARRHALNAPPGAAASTTSFVASAKKKTIAMSLTAKRQAVAKRTYEGPATFAHTSAATAPIGRSSDCSIAESATDGARRRARASLLIIHSAYSQQA